MLLLKLTFKIFQVTLLSLAPLVVKPSLDILKLGHSILRSHHEPLFALNEPIICGFSPDIDIVHHLVAAAAPPEVLIFELGHVALNQRVEDVVDDMCTLLA